jgi:hypothetical protein
MLPSNVKDGMELGPEKEGTAGVEERSLGIDVSEQTRRSLYAGAQRCGGAVMGGKERWMGRRGRGELFVQEKPQASQVG